MKVVFTDITCFYFTIYYLIKDKNAFLSNCYHWLKPGGKLIMHLVEKMFDPILPVANPLVMVSPQRYAKKKNNTQQCSV